MRESETYVYGYLQVHKGKTCFPVISVKMDVYDSCVRNIKPNGLRTSQITHCHGFDDIGKLQLPRGSTTGFGLPGG